MKSERQTSRLQVERRRIGDTLRNRLLDYLTLALVTALVLGSISLLAFIAG